MMSDTSSIIADLNDRIKHSLDILQSRFKTLRTGRASAAIFDTIKVDYHGAATPLNQMASISVPESRMVIIQPWDRTMLNEIEKAIQTSNLSLNPSNDGKILRITIPPLTEERRHEYVKLAKEIAEESRVAIRNIRRSAIEVLRGHAKNHEISEDDQHHCEKDIQKIIDEKIGYVNTLLHAKEEEILTI